MSKTPSKRNPVARFMNVFNRASTHKTRTTQTSRDSVLEGLSEVSSNTLRSSSTSSSAASYGGSSTSSDSGSSGGGCD